MIPLLRLLMDAPKFSGRSASGACQQCSYMQKSGRGVLGVFRIRKLTSLLAMVGVLFHAGLVVRHSSLMASVTIERAALADAFGVICHGNANADVSPDGQSPAAQDPIQKQARCPICLGFAGAAAVLPELPAYHLEHYATVAIALVAVDAAAPAIDALWPPGRGPPVDA